MESQIINFILFFFHLAGIIIGLGAVTVIDTMGVFARKSKYWVQVTIKAHHITKPLIWIGIILVTLTWGLMLVLFDNLEFYLVKSIIIFVLILNGIFLSFHVSKEVDKLKDKPKLFPKSLQWKTILSMLISFIFWWGFVLLTLIQLLA